MGGYPTKLETTQKSTCGEEEINIFLLGVYCVKNNTMATSMFQYTIYPKTILLPYGYITVQKSNPYGVWQTNNT